MNKITIENATYKWFDMKLSTYNKLETDDSIYLYYDGDEYAEIRIHKKDSKIFYTLKLYKEFSVIISLKFIEFEGFMVKWIEDTFDLMELTPSPAGDCAGSRLTIPKLKK